MRGRKEVKVYLFVYCTDTLIKGYSNYFNISMKNIRSDINILTLIHQGNIKTILGNNTLSFFAYKLFSKKIHDFVINFCTFKKMIG